MPGTYYGLSEKGWIDHELFKGWLGRHFYTHVVAGCPLLLLLDGHSSHYEPESLRCAKENDVIMFALPPHSSHDSQPLDLSVFGPLKTHWEDVCHGFMQQHPGRLVTKYSFSELFAKAWVRAVTPANVIAGFQKAGIYPFNPKAIKVPTGDVCDPAKKIFPVTSRSPSQLATTLSLPLQSSTTSPSSHPVRTPPQATLTSEQIARFE